MTGGRLAAVSKYIDNEDAFCFTYGDGVSDVNITDAISFHKQHGKKATVTAVYPVARFGVLDIDGDSVKGFEEKPHGDAGMINGGFFVLSPDVLSLISGPDCTWEQEPLKELASSGNLKAFHHNGFWQPMDTLRDKIYLEKLWNEGSAPWKTWD